MKIHTLALPHAQGDIISQSLCPHKAFLSPETIEMKVSALSLSKLNVMVHIKH